MNPITALIADDEPLLREVLQGLLAVQWPELQVVAQARNGLEAVEQFEALRPAVCFLDVHMPGLSGIEVAQRIGRRAHVVFITAFDHYALQAFAHGVFDYLVKPIQAERLADTTVRLRERLRMEQPAAATDALLQQLAVRREIHAGRVAGRRRQAGRSADPHLAQGTARTAGPCPVPAGAPCGGGQPAGRQPRDPGPEREGRPVLQAPHRGAAGQQDLPSPLQGRVRHAVP